MIDGTVTADREIVIPLDVLSPNLAAISIQPVVDTGFNGFLTFPSDVLTGAGAIPAGARRAELGDGKLVELDVYIVRVRWHDEKREVLALRVDATPLVGMSLLWGCRVEFDAQANGAAAIEPTT